MNLSRFALAFLLVVPAALFIAAAESAPDPAPAKAAPAPQANAGQAATTPEKPATPSAQALSPPLRTPMESLALPGSERADRASTAAILAAIRDDRGMAGADVSVNTENGVVTLAGIVRNREQAAIAQAYANRQLGVLRVDNELTIRAQ